MGSLAYLFGTSALSGVPFTLSPTPGFFYQVKKGDTPWTVANTAYKKPGLTAIKTALFLLNDNPWNNHIRKSANQWESYKIDGLQFTRQYDPNLATSTAGSGTAYPVLWVPPLDGKTPAQMTQKPAAPGVTGLPGATGQQGEQGLPGTTGQRGERGLPGATGQRGERGLPGATGQRGERGLPGAPGTASKQVIAKLIEDYAKGKPTTPGATGQQGKQGLPGATGQRGEQGLPGATGQRGERGLPGAPGTASKQAIANLIRDFVKDNPQEAGTPGAQGERGLPGATGLPGDDGLPGATGARGLPGAQGERGLPGKAGSSGEGGGFDMDTARSFVDSRIRTYARRYLKDVGPQDIMPLWAKLVVTALISVAISKQLK